MAQNNNNNNPLSNVNVPDQQVGKDPYNKVSRQNFDPEFYERRLADLGAQGNQFEAQWGSDWQWQHYQNQTDQRAGNYGQLVNQSAQGYNHQQLADQYSNYAADYYSNQSNNGGSDNNNQSDNNGGSGNNNQSNDEDDNQNPNDGRTKEELHQDIRDVSGYTGNFGNHEFSNWLSDQDSMTQNIVGNMVHGGMSRQEAISQATTGEMFQDVTNPELPDGTTFNPAMQEINDNEMLDSGDYQVNPRSIGYNAAQGDTATAQQPADLTAAQAEAYTIDPNNVPQAQAALGRIREEAKVEAAQGQLSEQTLGALRHAEKMNEEAQLNKRATVQHQYEQLTDFPEGEVPAWAKGAVKQAESKMAARGLGSSSIASGAVTGAVLQAAMPIAQQDAKAFEAFQSKKLDNKTQATLTKAGYLADMDMQNLDNRQQAAVQNARSFLEMDLQNLQNEQQASIVNAQAKQQQLLSNQAAKNAAENLNVQQRNQMKQFEAELSANISKFNASQRNAMERFNVGEVNAARRFNQEMTNQRQQFNVENRRLIDQFNAQYRRQVNTANTERQNRANFVNSKNLLNISNTAMNNALTYLRDQESFIFKASQNHLDRASNEAISMLNNEAAMNRLTERLDSEGESALWSALGGVAFNITNEAIEDTDFDLFGDGGLFGGGDDFNYETPELDDFEF